MANERQQSAGYGGGYSGGSKSSGSKSGGSKSSGSKSSGPGASAKGSPRTKHVGSLADYEKKRSLPKAFDYVPSAISKAVTGKFFASEPEFRQARDIKEAYRGYKASPPHAGMTGKKSAAPKGFKAAAGQEMAKAMQAKFNRPAEPPRIGPTNEEQQAQQAERKAERQKREQRERTSLPSGWSPPKKEMSAQETARFQQSLRASYGQPKSVKTSTIDVAAKHRERAREQAKERQRQYEHYRSRHEA